MLNEIIGRFRIRALLGRGGMAWVYLADDETGAPSVALKILDDVLMRDARHRDRFRREARAAARIQSPHVVGIREVGEDRGRPFIAMEYIEGETLERRLRRSAPLPVAEACAIGSDVARGLGAAHDAGVLHRDVKPSNVLIGKDGRARITDFGIAKVAAEAGMTRTGTVLGTAHYMSPEQALGEPVDERSDTYALGVLLHEMLTASVPFAGDTAVGVAMRHVTEAPPRARAMRPDIPGEVDELLGSLLAKDPARRPARLSKVVEILERFAGAPAGISGAPSPEEATARGAVSRGSPIVGRDVEVRLLRSLLHHAIAGRGHVVFITGEAGIGKSRLTRELASLAEHRGVRVVSAPAPDLEHPAPLGPFLEALRRHFRGGAVSEVEANWLFEYLEGEGSDLAPLLAASITAAPLAPPGPAFPDTMNRERLFGAMIEFLGAFANRKPTLLLLEDFHRADRASADLIGYLARSLPRLPLLVAVTVRSAANDAGAERMNELTTRLVARGEAAHVALSRLGKEDLGALLVSLYDRVDLSDELKDALFRRTAGNPLNILETLHLLESEGAIIRDGDHWLAVGAASDVPELPDTDLIVSRRLATLTRDERDLVEAAAVIGEEFEPEAAGRLAGLPRIRLAGILRSLEGGRHLVGAAASGMRFEHPRIREVIYDEIEPERRRGLHLAVAADLEVRGAPGTAEARTYALAHHYAAAGASSRALPYLSAAAAAAKRLFAYRDAAGYLSRAIAAADTLVVDTPLPDAAPAPTTAVRAGLHLELGRALSLLGEWEPASAALRRARELESEGAVPAAASSELGLIATRRGRWEDALRELNRARDGYHRLGAPADEGRIWRLIGNIYFERGDLARVSEHYEEALRIAEEAGDRGLAAHVLNNLGAVANVRGEREHAVQFFRRGLENFALAGDRLGEARGYHNLGLLFLQAKDRPLARSYLRRSLAISRAARDPGLVAITRLSLGEAALDDDDLTASREELLAALEIFCRQDDPMGEADARRLLGALLEREERFEEAEEAIRRSIELTVELGNRLQECESRRDLGRLLAKQGKTEEAREEFRRAGEGFRVLGASREVEAVEELAGQLAPAAGGRG